MKLSLTEATQTGMIMGHARFSRKKIGTGYVAIKIKIQAHEIEHDADATRRNDDDPCEIPYCP